MHKILNERFQSAAFLVFALLGIITVGPGCRSDPQALHKSRVAERIAVVCVGKDHLSYPVVQAAARQIAGHNGRLTIDVLASEHASPADQQAILKSVPLDRYDAICIHPIDPESIAGEMQRLAATGVPVIAFGRDAPVGSRSGYCGPLESDYGKATAAACEMLIKGRSNSIILLHCGADDPTYGARYQTFKTAIASIPGLNLLKEVDCHANRLDALGLVKAEARKYPRVAGWVFLGDWPLRGITENDRLLPVGSGIVLCDGDPMYFERIRDGRIEAMIGFDYRQATVEAVYTAIRLYESSSRGMNVSEVSVAPEVITRGNLAQWEARWRAWCSGEVSPTPTSRGS